LSRIYLDTSSTVLSRGTKLPRRRRVLVLKLQSKRCRTSRRVRSCIGLTRVEVSARSGVVARTSTLLRVTKHRHVYHVILCPTSSAVPVLLHPSGITTSPARQAEFLDLGAIPGLKTAPRPENSGPRPASFSGPGVLGRWRKLQRHRTRLRISRILPRANTTYYTVCIYHIYLEYGPRAGAVLQVLISTKYGCIYVSTYAYRAAARRITTLHGIR
jgi:hypothetical protein